MKSKMLLSLSLLSTLILPLVSHAGTEMHGGDSVVCFQDVAQKQKVETILRQNKLASQMGYIRQDPFTDIDLNTVTVETLDIWEAKQTVGEPKEFVEVTSLNEGVKDRIEAMKNKVLIIANKLENADFGFFNHSKWLASATGIVEIDDSHELINYTNLCIPVQIAVQTNTRVYYDARLFSKLDNLNKVALVLHEYLYSWVKTFSNSSLNVRKYIGLLMQKDFDSAVDEEIEKEMSVDFKDAIISYALWIDCEVSTVIDDEKVIIKYFHGGLNKKVCDERDERDERFYARDFQLSKSSTKTLSEKTGFELSGKIDGIWEDNLFKITEIRLKDSQKLTIPTVTPFSTTSYYTGLNVEEGKIILPFFPETAMGVNILNQDIELAYSWGGGIAGGDKLQYQKSSSGKPYLYKIQIGADMKLKSKGLRRFKRCDKHDFVTFNEEGLVLKCGKK